MGASVTNILLFSTGFFSQRFGVRFSAEKDRLNKLVDDSRKNEDISQIMREVECFYGMVPTILYGRTKSGFLLARPERGSRSGTTTRSQKHNAQ